MYNTLLYSTIGYNENFIGCLNLFCESLVYYNNGIDFLLLCDLSFKDECEEIIKKYNIKYHIHTFEDSKTPEEASTHKLRVFESTFINDYEKLLYVDLDTIFNGSIDSILAENIIDDKLYVYYEHDYTGHYTIYWSLPNYYTFRDHINFANKKIRPFNAGLFYFKQTEKMKKHFNNILKMIDEWQDEFYYEQSFMNCYFNKIFKTNNSIFDNNNYNMFVDCDKKTITDNTTFLWSSW
jgi:lipopolysaccharide biosynthesis glycosyltransferase